MSSDFYRAFEKRHRGSREVIKQRFMVYWPFVKLLKDIYGQGKTYDIGCGRGEWLELMAEMGLEPYGVDFDDGMLQDCYARNLPVGKGEGIAYLESLPDESYIVISAFHVIEHIPFNDLQTLIGEALRVLKPGGLLILETPNPENITVATANFYIDPTHIRPIPSQLLSFLTEYYGFARTKVLRLQEAPKLHDAQTIGLLNVLHGVSPDYAVIAQKQAPEEMIGLFDELFAKEFGISLEYLAARYELDLSKRFDKLAVTTQHLEARLAEAEAALASIRNSRSWRITRPLRQAAHALWWAKGGLFAILLRAKRSIKDILRPPLT